MQRLILTTTAIAIFLSSVLLSCAYPAPLTVTVTVTPQPAQAQTVLNPNQAPVMPTTTPALPTGTPAPATGKNYVGSKQSNKYHLPSCEWAQKIGPANEIWFSSPEDAKSRGYVPCKVCKPPS